MRASVCGEYPWATTARRSAPAALPTQTIRPVASIASAACVSHALSPLPSLELVERLLLGETCGLNLLTRCAPRLGGFSEHDIGRHERFTRAEVLVRPFVDVGHFGDARRQIHEVAPRSGAFGRLPQTF